jgi:hypothetical protein
MAMMHQSGIVKPGFSGRNGMLMTHLLKANAYPLRLDNHFFMWRLV